MTDRAHGDPWPAEPDFDRLRPLTVQARAIVELLRNLPAVADESSARYADIRAWSAGETWQHARDGVRDQDANGYVRALRGLLSTMIPLADAPPDLRAAADDIEQAIRTLEQDYRVVVMPMFNRDGLGLRPDLAAELAGRLPELADLV